MAQDISGTPLATAAAATSRQVAIGVYIDFNDLGFGVSPSLWTNITPYVKRLQGDHQATDWRKSLAAVGSGVSDEVTVTLRNPEETSPDTGLRYSSSNEGSSLYEQIGDGQINMKRAIVSIGFTYGGTDYGTRQITGYIAGVGEQRRNRAITFTIRDRAMDAILTRTSSQLYKDQTAKTYMQTLAGLLERDAVASADQLFDTGLVILPWMWLDDDSVWDEMSYVAEAQLGRIWFDKDGDLHLDDGTHFVKPSSNSYDDATTSQFTFTTANVQTIDGQYDRNSVFNDIIVEYQPRYVACDQVVYGATETIVIPPNSDKVQRCEFRYPVYDSSPGTSDTDLTVTIAACTAGGTDITSDVSYALSSTGYATYAEVTLTNANTNYAAYVHQLDIRGRPLLSEQADKYQTENTTSIASYGRRTWRVHNPYITTARHAQLVGDFLLARHKDPIHVVRIGGARGVPWLEPGDRVTVTDSLAGIDDEYFLSSIRWQFAPGAPYTMDLTAMKAADVFEYLDEYFIIGTSLYGSPYTIAEASAGTYARMFW